MTPDPVVLDDDSPLRTAALVLLRARIRGAPVVDRTGALIGMLSERHVLDKETARRAAGVGRRPISADGSARGRSATPAPALRSSRRPTARGRRRDGPARCRRLVVLDGARIVGIVSRHDVLRVLLRTDAELQEAVTVAMGNLDTDGLDMSVTDGVVEMGARAPTRSLAVAWMGAAQSVDGVIDVESRLTWDVDDLTPPVAL